MSNKFQKNDLDKPKLSLLPIKAKQEVAFVLEYGAKKYGRNNWSLCDDKFRYIDAALRHIDKYINEITYDEESLRHHLAHAVASLMFVIDMELD